MPPDALPPDPHGLSQLAEHVDPGSICRGGAAAALMERYPCYSAGLAWLSNFIMQPHAGLMRPGAVCPFVDQSMTQDVLTLAVRPGARGGARQAFDIMAPIADAFRAMSPTSGPLLGLKALTVFFPDLPRDDMVDFIDGGHRLLKPYMVERGLMIGEFQPFSEVPGASNPAFRPMRAPVPAFVLREMAMHDTKFINNDAEAPARRIMYLRSYLAKVGPTVPRKVRENAERMLAELENAAKV